MDAADITPGLEQERTSGVPCSAWLARAARWEDAAIHAKAAAPNSNADLWVAGFVAGLRSADVKIEQLKDLLRRGLGTSPSTLGDWKREVRREQPDLAG